MSNPFGRLTAALVATIALLGVLAAPALADRDFATRFQAETKGDIAIAANSSLSCPSAAGGCTTARGGSGGSSYNDAWTMANVDVDSETSTFNSSSANLTVPAGATVLFAGLYWGADTSGGAGGAAAPSAASRGSVLFKRAGSSAYASVTASQVDSGSASASRYQGFADVTADVVAARTGMYTVANIQAGTGADRYAGWSLVVAYSLSTQPNRSLTVLDGFKTVTSSNSATATVSNIQTPSSGAVNGKIGLVAYEGELGLTPESVNLNGSTFSDAANPSTNVLNASISTGGSTVTTRSPAYVDQLGFDADLVSMNGVLPNAASFTYLQMGSGSETYYPGVVSFAIDSGRTGPTSTSAPTVSGATNEGGTLTGTNGGWSGSPTSYAYQWLRCDGSGQNCAVITGATALTYTAVAADIGKTLRFRVTATNGAGSTSQQSGQTSGIGALGPAGTGAPVLSGVPRDGELLSTTAGSWSGTLPLNPEYTWLRCDASGAGCVEIPGATDPAYRASPADVGSTIRSSVTVTNIVGTATQRSAPSAVVAAIAPANVTLPSMTGTLQESSILSAHNGTWSGSAPLTLSYQWLRCNGIGAGCQPITGATGSTYPLVPADVAKTIAVAVTAQNSGGSSTATSAPDGPIGARPPVNDSLPYVTGTPEEASTLTALVGTWRGTDPISHDFEWLRCDAAGAGCTLITGQTTNTYALVPADAGKTIRARVHASNAGGAAFADSAPTGMIAARPPASLSAPSVTGTEEDGSTLTAHPGTWSGTGPITSTFRWLRCDATGAGCMPIPGATGTTYTLSPDDVGHRIRASETGLNSGGATSAQTSPTAAITARAPANTVAPSVSGTTQEGSTLVADPGTWTGTAPMTVTYQWVRCDSAGGNCRQISGATGTTYVLTAADAGSTVNVIVTAVNGGGTVPAGSPRTGTVVAKAITVPVTPDPDPTPVTPTAPTLPGQPAEPQDLSRLADSLVSSARCQQAPSVRTGTVKLAGVGRLRFKVLATDGAITSASPMMAGVDVNKPKAAALTRIVRNVAYKLDGRALATKRSAPYAVAIPPSRLASASAHKLTVSAASRRGKKSTVNVSFSTSPCTALLTANQRVAGGRGTLRLRVDSRSALRQVTFAVPSKLLPKTKGKVPQGRLQFVTTSGASRTFDIARKASDVAGSPKVSISGSAVTVSDIPAGTGIVKLELIRKSGAKPLRRAVSLTAVLSTEAGTKTLRGRVGPKRR